MTMHKLLANAIDAAIGAAAGGLLGLTYFSMLHRAVRTFVARPSWLRLLGLSTARIISAAALLTMFAKVGAAALLASLLGFLLARTRLLHRDGTPRAARFGEPR